MELTRSTLDNIRRTHGSLKAYNPMLEDHDDAVKFVSSKAVPTVKFDKSPQYNMAQYSSVEVQRHDEDEGRELLEFEGAGEDYAGHASTIGYMTGRNKETGTAPGSSLVAERYTL